LLPRSASPQPDANAAKQAGKDKEREGDKAKEWMKDERKPSPPPTNG